MTSFPLTTTQIISQIEHKISTSSYSKRASSIPDTACILPT